MGKNTYDCAVIGDWHLAFITAACLSSLGHKTLLVNPTSRWDGFPALDLNEPGLPEMIAASREKGLLDFANGVSQEWSADRIWLAIDTPVNERDEANLAPLREVASQVSKTFRDFNGPFIVSSQIPLGFSAEIEKDFGLNVAYIPENLRLGKGIETFINADRVVIGTREKRLAEEVRDFLGALKTEFLLCDLQTSEMIKHATNIFLATSISFANELARIGETLGADGHLVGKALKLDKRIGKQAYVIPGMGFAGGTLPRDLRAVQKIGRENEIPTPLVDAVLTVNESTSQSLVQILSSHLGSLSGKSVLILGYTYKADTDTLRRSPSIELANALKKHGARIVGFDPSMNRRDLTEIKGLIEHHDELGSIVEKPHAVVLMTPRREFSAFNWSTLGKLPAHKGANGRTLVLDTAAFLPSTDVKSAGFDYKILWRPLEH